ncbi:uncharacterized protein LOC141906871 isoform X2 [Tubulanus polymorphus]|uniref:uncharacterized protein LOC141906871 isoform X2 n=1 Tax=Tubulanus polymorphus TaxID=672921 RepID=UPI003DA4A6C7
MIHKTVLKYSRMNRLLLVVSLMGFIAPNSATINQTKPVEVSPINDFVTSKLRFVDSQCGCFPKSMIVLYEVTFKNLLKAKNPEIKLYGRLFIDTYRNHYRVDLGTISPRRTRDYRKHILLDVYANLDSHVLQMQYKGQPGGKCQNIKLDESLEWKITDRARCFLRQKMTKKNFISTEQQIASATYRYNPFPFMDMNVTFGKCCRFSSFTIKRLGPDFSKIFPAEKKTKVTETLFRGEAVSLPSIIDRIRSIKPFCDEPQQQFKTMTEPFKITRFFEMLDRETSND